MSNRFGPRTRLLGSGWSARVSQWMQRSQIKSIQRGTISIAQPATSNTATITAVVLTNTRIKFLGSVGGGDATTDPGCPRIALTDATTVTASVAAASAADARVVGYEVIEYWPGVIRSVQRGTITTTGAASNTATITAVTMAKSETDDLGFTTTGAQTSPAAAIGRVDLTNATTVTFTGVGGVDRVVGFQVVEWY